MRRIVVLGVVSIGDKFGRWEVTGDTDRSKSGHLRHECTCSCEKQVVRMVKDYDLITGRSTSCGCFRIESTIIYNTIHGKSRTKEYRKLIAKKHKHKNKERYKKYAENNKEKIAARKKEYRKNNKEKIVLQRRERYLRSLDESKMYSSIRRARKKDAVPKWGEEETKKKFLKLTK